jgi:hypothetical protein
MSELNNAQKEMLGAELASEFMLMYLGGQYILKNTGRTDAKGVYEAARKIIDQGDEWLARLAKG